MQTITLMPIDFQCTACQSRMRVADQHAGKLTSCPRCGVHNVVPSAALPPLVVAPATSFAPPGPSSTNPYAPPLSAPDETTAAIPDQEVRNVQVDIGPICKHAWGAWKARRYFLASIALFVFVVAFVAHYIAFGIAFGVLFPQGGLTIAILAILVLALPHLLQIFLMIGQTRVSIKLARGEPAGWSDLFSGGPRFFQTVGALVLAGVVYAAFPILAGMAYGPTLAYVMLIPSVLLLLMFWPFYYLIVDSKAGMLRSFARAVTITSGNWGTVIAVYFLSAFVMIIGLLALIVGVFLAGPLVSLLWATMYLMMSGQIPTQTLFTRANRSLRAQAAVKDAPVFSRP